MWDLAWHPLGHVLASVGHDHMAKFWARKRPGDPMQGTAAEYEKSSVLGALYLESRTPRRPCPRNNVHRRPLVLLFSPTLIARLLCGRNRRTEVQGFRDPRG